MGSFAAAAAAAAGAADVAAAGPAAGPESADSTEAPARAGLTACTSIQSYLMLEHSM